MQPLPPPTPVAALLAVFLGAFAPGCVGQECDTHGQAPQRYSGGRTNADRSFYESSSSDGPFLFFPAGRTYRFEHGLSETPAEYHALMAWIEFPLRDQAGISESAGNQAMFELIDETAIEVRNDTCAELYLRLWARVAPFETADADGDAGATPSPEVGATEGDATEDGAATTRSPDSGPADSDSGAAATGP